jgi:hypothetical protein
MQRPATPPLKVPLIWRLYDIAAKHAVCRCTSIWGKKREVETDITIGIGAPEKWP